MNTQKNNSRRIANTQKKKIALYFILFIRKFNYKKNQILNNFSYLILNYVRFRFDMLLLNIKQVNLEYTLRRMKQNLKHAIPIQTKN